MRVSGSLVASASRRMSGACRGKRKARSACFASSSALLKWAWSRTDARAHMVGCSLASVIPFPQILYPLKCFSWASRPRRAVRSCQSDHGGPHARSQRGAIRGRRLRIRGSGGVLEGCGESPLSSTRYRRRRHVGRLRCVTALKKGKGYSLTKLAPAQ
jgi:hypothetical protein